MTFALTITFPSASSNRRQKMSERQLIDSQGNFQGGLEPLEASRSSTSYTIISVVGCQSGGKSTLLNTAFSTSFPVLNAPKHGRRRTTLGVWAVTTPQTDQSPALVILDVEGTDSRERGEGAVSFESRTALFALAVSDVVLVNMWAHDIGRHTAANYDLFETVFSRASASASRKRRVKLVVVVRDCEEDAPVKEICRVLTGDLENIWLSLKLPAARFDALFDLDVVALPHKVYAADAFEREARSLGLQIGKGGVEQAGKQPVPLEGFDTYAREVWREICDITGGEASKGEFSLDLPKHIALTAHFKCGEVVSGIFDGQVGVRMEEMRAEIESEWRRPIPEFGTRVDAFARDAFAEYDAATKAYREVGLTEDAVVQRRVELGRSIASRLSELRERYLWVCRDSCMNGFEDDFRPMLGGTNGYERNAKRLANSFVARYRSLVEGARLPGTVTEFIEAEDVEGGDDGEIGSGNVETIDLEDALLSSQLGRDGSSDEDDIDEYSCEAFKRDVMRLVEDRKRLGELMLPGAGTNFAAGPKRDPWWKGLLIRGVILLINYLQASQGQRAAIKLHRKHEKEFPPGPTF